MLNFLKQNIVVEVGRVVTARRGVFSKGLSVQRTLCNITDTRVTYIKIVFAAFAPGARHKRKCEGFCVCVIRHVMSLNSVQSFVIENCNGPTIENGLNNVCLHPLSRTFTFTYLH